MRIQNTKSDIIYHFGDSKEALKNLKEKYPNASITTRLAIAERKRKIRGYLEKRFYKYGIINKGLYQMVDGDLKFLGL